MLTNWACWFPCCTAETTEVNISGACHADVGIVACAFSTSCSDAVKAAAHVICSKQCARGPMHNMSKAQNTEGNEGNLNLANPANKTALSGPEQTRFQWCWVTASDADQLSILGPTPHSWNHRGKSPRCMPCRCSHCCSCMQYRSQQCHWSSCTRYLLKAMCQYDKCTVSVKCRPVKAHRGTSISMYSCVRRAPLA